MFCHDIIAAEDKILALLLDEQVSPPVNLPAKATLAYAVSRLWGSGLARSQDEARRLREAWTTGYKRDVVRRDATRTPPVLGGGSYSPDLISRAALQSSL